MSWISAHGNIDDLLTIDEKTEVALHRKLIFSCGYASLWVSSLLKKFNINNRRVAGLTLDKWNSYDNGHTMLEIMVGNKWIAYDVSNHIFFKDKLHYLDMYELCNVVSNHQDYEMIFLIGHSQYDINIPYTLWYESIMSSEECLRKWYDRVFQLPLIEQNNQFYFCDARNKERVEAYADNYQYMAHDIFMEKFYSADK